MRRLVHIDMGRASYGAALELQKRLVGDVLADEEAAYLVTVEHDPPAVTLGRRGKMKDILLPAVELARRGIEIHRTSRGGLVTYHGPGQLAAYPIWRLGRGRRTVHGHVRNLEEAIIELLGRFAVAGHRRDGTAGVFVGRAKVAALGVAVDHWVCYHGAAVNVNVDPSQFEVIVPCGRRGSAVGSMAQLAGKEISVEAIVGPFVEELCRRCGFDACRTVCGEAVFAEAGYE